MLEIHFDFNEKVQKGAIRWKEKKEKRKSTKGASNRKEKEKREKNERKVSGAYPQTRKTQFVAR